MEQLPPRGAVSEGRNRDGAIHHGSESTSNSPGIIVRPTSYAPLTAAAPSTSADVKKLSSVPEETMTELTLLDFNGSDKSLANLSEEKENEVQHLNAIAQRLGDQITTQKRELSTYEARLTRCRTEIIRLLIDQEREARREARDKCVKNNIRLGQNQQERTGAVYHEKFVEGEAYKTLQRRQSEIAGIREELDRRKKQLQKRRPGPPDKAPKMVPSPVVADDGFARPADPQPSGSSQELTFPEYFENSEVINLRIAQLKREETELGQQKEKLDLEKNVHMRETKRIHAEDTSRHNDFSVLHSRYLLLSLLGKGGFCEVYKAYDLEDNRHTACKIHHVNPDWKDEKKSSYVKHAIREKDIHRTLVHPRIVRLYDVFTIDKNSFSTVLEYVCGNDLDFYIKQHKLISERESKNVIRQLISALKYLSELKPPIIHYDLKPANILLCNGSPSGDIKVTDFGLAKIMEDELYDPDQGMDLTSQFAGTYWYLPPECFVTSRTPKISAKVDVWSTGIIFYQCLYGKRPFAHNQSQQAILETNAILRATEVNFPINRASTATVSNEAKAFIRSCLQYRAEDRADVSQLYNSDYLQPKPKERAKPSPVQANSASNSSTATTDFSGM